LNLENYAFDANYSNLENYAFDANYSNLENYAFDANYLNLENYARGLPINKIAPTLCIYEIFRCVDRQKKELVMEVTSKKLCRCVWLKTSFDVD
jgi:hypothetical protein